MGLILYNPTWIKRKVINQVISHDACTYLRFAIEIHTIPLKILQHRAIHFVAPPHGLEILNKPTDKGKVELKHLDSK